MKRVFRVLDDPLFGMIVGVIGFGLSLTDWALRRRRSRQETWDKALEEELPHGAEAN